jgi:DNA-binding transcriptional regulator YdaS (Cro superfamily)
MQLSEYLEKHGLSQEAFAGRFKPKLSQGLIHQWLAWLKDPTKGTKIKAERATEIEQVTNGEVSRSELRPDLWPLEKARAA